VLDEPTNDLDLETLELLEDLLMEFQGTLLVVSHDRAFLDNVVRSTLAWEGDGQWRDYIGGYSDWLRQKASAEPSPAARPARTQTERAPASPRRVGFKEKRELHDLPGRIEKLEAEKQELYAVMATPNFYATPVEEMSRMRERLAAIEAAIHSSYARWMELEALVAGGGE
jgi:ATP-binding cassette subfamily F protein uup